MVLKPFGVTSNPVQEIHSFLAVYIYRPPSSNIQCSNKITGNIEIAISLNENIVILGDLNINVSDCNHPCNSKYQSMCDLFDLTYSLP